MVLGTAGGVGMAGSEVPQHQQDGQPAAPCPAQGGGSTAGLSRISSAQAPAGSGMGMKVTTLSSSGSLGGMKAAGSPAEGCAGEAAAGSRVLSARQMPPLPIISSSFLIYLNKQAECLPQLEVFE